MISPNIAHYPLNRMGALELGLDPCTHCNNGFSNFSTLVCITCRDTCNYLKLYYDKERMEQIKLKE